MSHVCRNRLSTYALEGERSLLRDGHGWPIRWITEIGRQLVEVPRQEGLSLTQTTEKRAAAQHDSGDARERLATVKADLRLVSVCDFPQSIIVCVIHDSDMRHT